SMTGTATIRCSGLRSLFMERVRLNSIRSVLRGSLRPGEPDLGGVTLGLNQERGLKLIFGSFEVLQVKINLSKQQACVELRRQQLQASLKRLARTLEIVRGPHSLAERQ